MRLFKKFLYFFVLSFAVFVFFGLFSSQSDAVDAPTIAPTSIPTVTIVPEEATIPCPKENSTPTPTPTLAVEDWQYEDTENETTFSTDPPAEDLAECIVNVKVIFHGLTPDQKDKYVLCTGSEDCLSKNPVQFASAILEGCDNFIDENGTSNEGCGNLKKFSSDAEGNVTIKMCGDGSTKVKVENACPDNSKKNYLHGGNIYIFALYGSSGKMLVPGAFYVSRSYPTLSINPNQGLTIKSSIQVDLSQDFYRPGGEKRNNYQISLAGGEGYRMTGCVAFKKAGEKAGSTFNNLTIGTYVLTIKEQVNEKQGLSIKPLDLVPGIGTGKIAIGLFKEARRDECQGGFTYYQIRCRVTNTNGPGGTCSKIEEGKDPKGEEYQAFLKDLALLNKVGAGASFPCESGKGNMVRNPAQCKHINTAIGPIQVTVQGLIQTVFKFTLTLAGFGGIIILIYSGYLLMISRGDKEKLQGAKETITAAIVGLLFIILSIVILEIIGIDILRIPGFER